MFGRPIGSAAVAFRRGLPSSIPYVACPQVFTALNKVGDYLKRHGFIVLARRCARLGLAPEPLHNAGRLSLGEWRC